MDAPSFTGHVSMTTGSIIALIAVDESVISPRNDHLGTGTRGSRLSLRADTPSRGGRTSATC